MDAPRFRLVSVILYGFVSLWSLFVIIPSLWMVVGAFKTKREFFLEPLGLPGEIKFDAFERAMDAGVGNFLINSMLVTTLSVIVIVVVSGMAAYVLARVEGRWMRVIYLLIVAGFAVPVQAVLIPLYQLISGAGMLNSLFAIVLPYAAYGIPFTIVLFYAFFLDFPRELEEAALLDGCRPARTFFNIVLPLTGPAIASAAIFQAVFIWNEFILALLLLTRAESKTLTVGILQLGGEYTSDWAAILAGLTIAILPLLLIFIFAQKYFVRSLAGLGK